MKVLYDHQAFSLQKHGGISRYYAELIKQFTAIDEVAVDIAIKYTNNEYLECLDPYSKKIASLKNPVFSNKTIYGLNLIHSIRMLVNNKYDIFHPTYYDPYYIKYLSDKPIVITVYDLIHEKFPEYFINTSRHYNMKRKTLARADKIIAISEQTKIDILKYYDVDPSKIKVIYLASSLDCSASLLSHPEHSRYLLYVGNRDGYKNFVSFIDAAQAILKSDRELRVVCFGGGNFTKKELMKFHSMGILNQMTHTQGNDETLVQYYRKAKAFIFPSLYEGFGIPVLEAMSCGCPTLISNSGSLPEVGGDATVYFDPNDLESIASAIEQVIYSEAKQKELKDMGYRQNSKFTWKVTADETQAIYRSLL